MLPTTRSPLLAVLLLALASSWTVTAAPASSPSTEKRTAAPSPPTHHVLSRRRAAYKDMSREDLVAWTKANTANLRHKYASKLKSSTAKLNRRDTPGETELVNYQHDSTFYASVEIGTPAQPINLILDTGSSDVWVVQGKDSYDAAESSTFVNSTTPFEISYGSGDVAGTLATDTMTLAGHTSSKQTYAIAEYVTSGLLDNDVDGIMGFGFPSLSTSKATPFWQASGSDIFSFYLHADSSATTSSSAGSSPGSPSTSPGTATTVVAATSDSDYGGVLTIGGKNSSLYQGDINWSDVVDESYWLITLGGITVGGTSITLEGTSKTAVDTGTTLIGVPTAVATSIYSQISGASTISGDTGYYEFPCSTDVNATMHFGDQVYTLTSTDLNAGTLDTSGETCMGAFFSIGSDESDELQYILGDAFLTNVYSIFNNTGSTAYVGFASLAAGLSDSTTSTTTNRVTSASGAMSLSASGISMAVMAAVAVVALL